AARSSGSNSRALPKMDFASAAGADIAGLRYVYETMRSPRPLTAKKSAAGALSACTRLASAEALVEPGPGVTPVPVRGARGDAEDGRGFLEGQAGEEVQLDQFGGLGLLPREEVERLIHGQEVEVPLGRGQVGG